MGDLKQLGGLYFANPDRAPKAVAGGAGATAGIADRIDRELAGLPGSAFLKELAVDVVVGSGASAAAVGDAILAALRTKLAGLGHVAGGTPKPAVRASNSVTADAQLVALNDYRAKAKTTHEGHGATAALAKTEVDFIKSTDAWSRFCMAIAREAAIQAATLGVGKFVLAAIEAGTQARLAAVAARVLQAREAAGITSASVEAATKESAKIVSEYIAKVLVAGAKAGVDAATGKAPETMSAGDLAKEAFMQIVLPRGSERAQAVVDGVDKTNDVLGPGVEQLTAEREIALYETRMSLIEAFSGSTAEQVFAAAGKAAKIAGDDAARRANAVEYTEQLGFFTALSAERVSMLRSASVHHAREMAMQSIWSNALTAYDRLILEATSASVWARAQLDRSIGTYSKKVSVSGVSGAEFTKNAPGALKQIEHEVILIDMELADIAYAVRDTKQRRDAAKGDAAAAASKEYAKLIGQRSERYERAKRLKSERSPLLWQVHRVMRRPIEGIKDFELREMFAT